MNNFILFGFLMSLTFIHSVIGEPPVCLEIPDLPILSNGLVDFLFALIDCLCTILVDVTD
ncbi:hypothetical protein Anas_05162 [Armadillidium nasatum]|uniref:Uncharacterized protein n=1 Tax=Armadillidium nasatum TaxID=96803 RepID=A0A5N5SKT4_9CRUS|nr:hypothetical protein Anas_05162 [Armadillidium nasatum]